MAKKLTTTKQINNYVQTVLNAANHHASEVEKIIPKIETEILQRLNLGSDTIEVYERNGKIARTCWVNLNGNRYVFTYNYLTKKIDLKQKSLQGKLIASFDNSTSISNVRVTINKL